jgi:diguanylate cyclase (GGDEF)-like protein/PAS domain S-box-containing protein
MADSQRTKTDLLRELTNLRHRHRELRKRLSQLQEKEKALRGSEGYLETLVEATPDVIYALSSEEGRITFLNKAFEDLTGWTRGEWLGHPFMGLIHAQDVPLAVESYQQALKGNSPSPLELRILTKSGSYLTGEFTIRAHRSQEKVNGALGIARNVTKRKDMERSWISERERFQTLIENAPFGMMMIDPHGAITYLNPKFTEIFGYTLKDLPNGRTWVRQAYPDPEYRHRVVAEWKTDLAKFSVGEKRPRVFTVTCKNGGQKIIKFIPVQLRSGENLMSCEDITEITRAQQELQQSEEKYRTILATIEDGYYEVDLAGNIVFFNEAYPAIMGYPPEELPGKNYREYVDPENAKKIYDVFNAVYRTGHPSRGFDWEVIRKDGSRGVIDCSVSLIRDEKGKAVGFRGILRDRTAHRRVEASIRESERRLKEMLENLELLVVELAQDGRITYVNPYFLQITGYSLKEVLGMDFFEGFLDQALRPEIQKIFSDLLAQGLHTHHENPILTRLGNERLISWNNTVLRDPLGRAAGTLSLGRDITEERQAQRILQKLTTLDGLTGIANRRHFDDVLAQEWRRALRDLKPLSLIMGDIDFFKAFNDTYGHQMGDYCLKKVAAALSEPLKRPGDLVARYGGEEFVVILPDTGLPGALQIARTMRSQVEELGLPHDSSPAKKVVTISLGVATIVPSQTNSSAALITAVDQALYKAKHEGRNCVREINLTPGGQQ